MARLTAKQKKFVEEYLIDLNATQASIRAGYSVDSAGSIGEENLRKPEIANAISVKMAQRSKRTGVNQDRVVEELAKMAFVNMGDLVDTDSGSILEDATQEDLASVESIKVKEFPTKDGGKGVEKEVKVASKLKALELLGKHLGMWNDKFDVNVTLPVVISGGESLED